MDADPPDDVLDDLALRLCVPRSRLDTALSDSGAVIVYADGLNNGDRLVQAGWWSDDDCELCHGNGCALCNTGRTWRVLTDKEPTDD